MCRSKLIAALVTHKIRDDPHYKVKHIQSDVKNKYGLDVTYRKAWYARQKCIEQEYGKFGDSYNELPFFLQSVQTTNPSTVVEIEYTESNQGAPYCDFLYAFWVFKPAIDGFRFCFPVISVDGTHLYGNYKGHLFLVVGMNANREIFPLAYSIVDSENAASWTWFMTLLATHVFPDHESVCIISDRHAGIDAAFRDLSALHPPRVQRRYCLRHIRSNVMTRNRNRRLRALIWEVGIATTRREFGNKIERIRAEWPAAYNYLATIDTEKWALSHDGGHRYGIMTTNSS
ncbi:uncharacterized protein LOC116020333 [Ipomoea triloba]|uniref:uncharacterized protein LOC116020333 n=1 Tax=Ipomoea triloba TaxID=35885 RepID=UPI00125DB195|nr:uncharacterized protein LOC116020333 [Ipomoea triloba]